MPDAVHRFGPQDLTRFLEEVDRQLSTDNTTRILIIGGAALAIGYGVTTGTDDIDTFETQAGRRELAQAVKRAQAQTGLPIALGDSTVADIPHDAQGRARPVLTNLEKLKVWVLEKHDVALSKIWRGVDHDIEQLEELNKTESLELETLIDRWLIEMTHAIGDTQSKDLGFFNAIERLFGRSAARNAEQQVTQRRALVPRP